MPRKTSSQCLYRRHVPAQHAKFLRETVEVDFTNPCPTASSDPATQAEFDHFYAVALQLLNQYYPERVITKTSRDPEYITAHIKVMLRKKNRLMRAGRVEEAGAPAKRIGRDVQLRCKSQLDKIDGKTDAKSMWACLLYTSDAADE